MGKREFLLSMGPYRNIYMTEDREWWGRLAKLNALILLKHRSLKTQLSRTKRDRIKKIFYVTFMVMVNDLWHGIPLFKYIKETIKNSSLTIKSVSLRLFMIPFAWIYSKLKSNPLGNERYLSLEEFRSYYNKNRGTYPENNEASWLSCNLG